MSIFKFHSGDTKPSALKIWTTLIDTPIHPREGYTEDQIRYRMFIRLQLASEFKLAVLMVNGIIDSGKAPLEPLLSATRAITSCQESDFSYLSVLSRSFPDWVSSELYTPYYLTKMLCHKLNSTKLLMRLFDRTELPIEEISHWNIDHMPQDFPGLTAYKLYNSMHMDEMLPYITISYDRTPHIIYDKHSISSYIRYQLMQSIEVSDNHIVPENAKTTIPYFILKASDASQ